MNQADLAQLSTHWSNIFRAREAEGDAAMAARNALLLRYAEVVLRYLRAVLRDPQAVDQVCSNFAMRVLESDRLLQKADPQRGRFRDYLRTVLQHMIADYYREQKRQRKQQDKSNWPDNEPADPDSPNGKQDQQFAHYWREELVKWVWNQLEERDNKTGQRYAVLLRLQAQQPQQRSTQLAEQLTAKLGRPVTAAGVRQLLHRGRELFGELLVAEVARSLQADPTDPEGYERVEQELIDLGLLFSYCKNALQRCRPADREPPQNKSSV